MIDLNAPLNAAQALRAKSILLDLSCSERLALQYRAAGLNTNEIAVAMNWTPRDAQAADTKFRHLFRDL